MFFIFQSILVAVQVKVDTCLWWLTQVLVTVLTILLTTILVSSIICWRRKIWTASDKTISTSGFNSRFLLSRWTAPLSGDPLNSGQLVLSEVQSTLNFKSRQFNKKTGMKSISYRQTWTLGAFKSLTGKKHEKSDHIQLEQCLQ